MSEVPTIISENQLFHLCKNDTDFRITVGVGFDARMVTCASTSAVADIVDVTDCIPNGKRLAEKEIEGLIIKQGYVRLVSDSVNEIIQRPEVFQKIKKKIETEKEKWGNN